MSELQSVTLNYGGKDYEVAAEKVWGLIESIEDVITFLELAPMFQSRKYQAAKIFRAYAAALKYAGCETTQDEIRKASDYRKMGEYAGQLGLILIMGQPGAAFADADPTSAPVEPKKKPRSARNVSKRG